LYYCLDLVLCGEKRNKVISRNAVSLRSLAPGCLPLQRFASVQFSNSPLGFEHENWPNRNLVAGTLQRIGHNRGVPGSVPGRTKQSSMFASRKALPAL
jgi:hypothetical protein